jgi:hypothetical protein
VCLRVAAGRIEQGHSRERSFSAPKKPPASLKADGQRQP